MGLERKKKLVVEKERESLRFQKVKKKGSHICGFCFA